MRARLVKARSQTEEFQAWSGHRRTEISEIRAMQEMAQIREEEQAELRQSCEKGRARLSALADSDCEI